MTVTALTTSDSLFVLTLDTRSADILDAGGTVATTPADGWEVDLALYEGRPILLKFLADASGDAVVLTAGDRPPAERGGLATGTTTEMPLGMMVTLDANDVRYIAIESARFMQDDGYIRAVCVDAGTSMAVFVLPRAWT